VERIFQTDRISKLERVELTLNCKPVDRLAILEQLSYNPGVIAMYTGKLIRDFGYTMDDICQVIRRTTDLAMPPVPPRGTARVTSEDGFVVQNDNWTCWYVSRPFKNQLGARDWLRNVIQSLREAPFDREKERLRYRAEMIDLQRKIGETVILNYSCTGMCSVFARMGLEIFTFFIEDYPEVMDEYMAVSVGNELRRIHAVADRNLSPVILIPEDFATRQGPIFPPHWLQRYHYRPIRKLADAWHEHRIKVLYHSDGNFKKAIPDLLECGVDGFYCLEPNCATDIVELKNAYPHVTWAGGVDGVDLMERGTPEQVRQTVRRQIERTNALQTGGMFVASSSEINPPIKPENFQAMVQTVGEMINPSFRS